MSDSTYPYWSITGLDDDEIDTTAPAAVVHHETCTCRECPECFDCIDPDWNLSVCRRCTVRSYQDAWSLRA
jgi:hypothetical protein